MSAKTTIQMGKNLMMNILSFIINVVVGLWLVPYLIDHIGVAAYGLVPLSMIFTDYMSVINVSVNTAVSRFYLIEVQKKNWRAASSVFSTALFSMLALILLQAPILTLISINVQHIVDVPTDLLHDAIWLFGLTFSGYLISLISSILNTSMYANNRLDLSRLIDIVRIVVRVGGIIVLFSFWRVSLISVGIASLIAAICVLLLSFYWNRKLTPNVKINVSLFDIKRIKGVFFMGGWLIINQVGYLLFLKIDIFLVNKILGAESGGIYAAVAQWNGLIRTFAGILSGVFAPVIMIQYAHNAFDKVISYTKFSIKYLTLIMVLVCGLIAGFGKPLLFLWLGDEFSSHADVLAAMILPLAFAMGSQSALAVNKAYNKVKIPGIMTLIIGFLNLITSYLLLFYGYGFMGIALSGSIWLLLKNSIFTPIYAAHIMKINLFTFIRYLPVNIMFITAIYITCKLICRFFLISSWGKLILSIFIMTTLYCIVLWFFIIPQQEQQQLKNILKKR